MYDAWGNITAQEETVPNRFKFTGQQLDPVTQQYYLRARFYNPVVARFTQEDTYRGDGLNLYAYCENNPVFYVDPSGHQPNCVKDAAARYMAEGMSKEDAFRRAYAEHAQWKLDDPNISPRERADLIRRAERLGIDVPETVNPAHKPNVPEAEVPEVFYRTMSHEQYDILRMTGEVQPTGETFISPTQSFSEDYDGVTVRLEVRQGTTKQLTQIGVSDGSRQATKDYGPMPACTKGWGTDHAFFKGEGSQTNIGLGQGRAREIFNQNLIGFQRVGG